MVRKGGRVAFRTAARENHSPELPTGGREWNNPWWMQAACRGLDTELFFDNEGYEGTTQAVARMCFDCPVMVTCRLAGYAEYHGMWGNTLPTHRDRNRSAIFRRLFGRELDADDGLGAFRRAIYNLIERGSDVLATMRDYGFTSAEIGTFLQSNHLEGRAEESTARQEKLTTKDVTFRNLANGVAYHAG